MTMHIVEFNLVNHVHLCNQWCQYAYLVALRNRHEEWRTIQPGYGPGKQYAASGESVQYGAWPGGCETDYDEWCAQCGAFLWHGLSCECEDKSVDRLPVDLSHTYGGCGVEGCLECRPLFDEENNEIAGTG